MKTSRGDDTNLMAFTALALHSSLFPSTLLGLKISLSSWVFADTEQAIRVYYSNFLLKMSHN